MPSIPQRPRILSRILSNLASHTSKHTQHQKLLNKQDTQQIAALSSNPQRSLPLHYSRNQASVQKIGPGSEPSQSKTPRSSENQHLLAHYLQQLEPWAGPSHGRAEPVPAGGAWGQASRCPGQSSLVDMREYVTVPYGVIVIDHATSQVAPQAAVACFHLIVGAGPRIIGLPPHVRDEGVLSETSPKDS